eukprot:m.47795 g.47795  ORF g.47795 m.47795 type:complete len:113 (+) comp33821_c0_seq3:135-473(+)
MLLGEKLPIHCRSKEPTKFLQVAPLLPLLIIRVLPYMASNHSLSATLQIGLHATFPGTKIAAGNRLQRNLQRSFAIIECNVAQRGLLLAMYALEGLGSDLVNSKFELFSNGA